jgi:multidrug efflux system membrane fusion protein
VCTQVLLLAGCTGRDAQPQAAAPAPAVPVAVAEVVQKTVPVELRAIGNVEPYSTVSVRTQIAGFVERAFFTEGQAVKEGDLLFTLDARPYRAEIEQLEANLARNRAQLENARAQADRYEKLYEQGIVSQDQFDSFQTNANALAAAVRADEAAIEKAKVDLDYCSIHAPISGRTGDLLVHPGNIVKANETVLVVINQVNPVYISFAVPEQSLAEIRRHRERGSLRVHAVLPDDSGQPARGALTFIDNTVDRTTGTIRLKATFPNRDNRLWPGQFVNVVVELAARPNALVVPSRAVQSGQSGQHVFVIQEDMTAASRPVIVGATVGEETVIEEGLRAGERVVTDGQLRLTPGARVEIKGP